MPKRHRQPEPIDIIKAGKRPPKGLDTASRPVTHLASAGNRPASSAAVSSSVFPSKDGDAAATAPSPHSSSPLSHLTPAYSEGGSSEAVFPATPSTLTQRRKLEQRRHRAVRPRLEDYGDSASAGSEDSVASNTASDQIDYDSSDYGDDGNQVESDAESDLSEDSEEAQALRRLRRAVVAAGSKGKVPTAGGAELGESDDDSHGDDDGSSGDSGEDDDDDSSSDLDHLAEGEETEEEDEEGSDVFDEEYEEEEGEEGELGSGGGDPADNGDEDDEDDDDATGGSGLVTVDFGVYDMKPTDVDAVMHLMDQFCPDKMNEVDRDELGATLAANPYTYVVKVTDNGGDEDDDNIGKAAAEEEEEEEFYGLASALDCVHGLQSPHPVAYRSLLELLKNTPWRTAAPGIPPTDILLRTEDGGEGGKKAAKAGCILLMLEYIRNVPLELTVQILEDLVNRLEADSKSSTGASAGQQQQKEEGDTKDGQLVRPTFPCMFAILAKVQRAMDAPVTLERAKAGDTSVTETASSEGKSHQQQTTATAASSSSAKKKGKKGGATTAAVGGGGEAGPASGREATLDLSRYIFWREEDNVLFDFRDKRVATFAYRCRPQYDSQPESDIPLSLLFVLQYGALRQAIDEMKRREATQPDIVRY